MANPVSTSPHEIRSREFRAVDDRSILQRRPILDIVGDIYIIWTGHAADDSRSWASDAVFGVKSSLIVQTTLVDDEVKARELGFQHAPYHLLERDYVLLTTDQAAAEKRKSLAAFYASMES